MFQNKCHWILWNSAHLASSQICKVGIFLHLGRLGAVNTCNLRVLAGQEDWLPGKVALGSPLLFLLLISCIFTLKSCVRKGVGLFYRLTKQKAGSKCLRNNFLRPHHDFLFSFTETKTKLASFSRNNHIPHFWRKIFKTLASRFRCPKTFTWHYC